MKVLATADLHGVLPEIPECDVLLIAGDVAPDCPDKRGKYYEPLNGSFGQLAWLDEDFRPWLEEKADRGIHVVGIAGNHDFVFEELEREVEKLELPWTYLCDHTLVWNGLTIHGTPWVPGLRRWAFYGRPEYLELRAAVIPEGIDILLSHGPPWGTADFVAPQFGSQHVGDAALDEHLRRIKPKALVCGHIHEQYGIHDHKHTTVYNASHNTEFYEPINEPLHIQL